MPCASFAKIALLVFYLRLSPQQWFKYSCWATIAVIAAYTPAIFLALLFACKPVNASWRIDIEGECIDNTALFIATCVVNSFTDVVLFLLPIPSKLTTTRYCLIITITDPQQLSWVCECRSPKSWVYLDSSPLASCKSHCPRCIANRIDSSRTIITSVIRAAILPQMAGADQSWITASASVWSQLECNLLVICGTIPTLKKFFRHVAPKVLGSTDNSKTGSTPNVPRTQLYNRSRNPYAQFGQDASELELTRWDQSEEVKVGAGVSTTITTGDPRPKSEDDSSEKAIMETRYVEQTVEHRR